jgi:hypothetical protein
VAFEKMIDKWARLLNIRKTSFQLQGGAFMIFDKVFGFLNTFLAMLAPRESILLGKILSKFPEIVLTMDRTDWGKHRKHINILSVAVRL